MIGISIEHEDAECVARRGEAVFRALHGSRILLTGGTGFVGTWLLRTLLVAREMFGVNVEVIVLTRDPDAFMRRHPGLAVSPAVVLLQGDVRRPIEVAGRLDLIVHAASEMDTTTSGPPPSQFFDVILGGTLSVVECARRSGARVCFVSSGAVYGNDAFAADRNADEESTIAPLTTRPQAAYANAKRAAEAYLCAVSANDGPDVVIGRLFSFLGPGQELGSRFVIASMLHDALQGGPVVVKSDGTLVRSFMYAADMALWLWTIAVRGQRGVAYNVGSEEAFSVADIARIVAAAVGDVSVSIAKSAPRPETGLRYVPSTLRARRELELPQLEPLRNSVARTVRWARSVL